MSLSPFFDRRRDSEGAGDWKSLPESDLAARRTEFEFIRVVLLGLGVIRITGRPTRPAAPHPGPEGPRTHDSRARPASVPVAATVTASGPAAFRQDRPPTRRSERPKAAKPTASRPALTAAVDLAGPDPGMNAQGPIEPGAAAALHCLHCARPKLPPPTPTPTPTQSAAAAGRGERSDPEIRAQQDTPAT